MNLLITICGRGGSKGIVKKNIYPINDKPLIHYSIHHAQEYAKKIGGADIELSTDSQEIADTAAAGGLHTEYMRPAELGSDSAGKLETIKDVLLYAEKKNSKRYDYVLDLDVTSPLRTIEDLEKGFAIIDSDPNARNLFSVSFPKHNPYFDIVEPGTDDYYQLVKQPESQINARQEGPRAFEVNASFYFYRRAFFDEDPLRIIGNTLVYETPHMCFEVDEILELEFLDFLISEDKLNFDFK
ncbi:MAG: acylneuraminate cytidylyltransferase family protein [Candidatus Peribacter sp.]|jgi:CMP-N,N'-diacetyllegionaminic acid synthase|nr:acylneuraminate cytidylyltransferase family protein [Candidatus Peribacter sp.]MBT4393178.1 acylneuraminate cytidylyltransferase family protein [Candidatus Peribacter sp.]MBT4600478.1 acylneuraminate cytidylyltransferase family protein [Candidatus Peribacter sp.]MBT5148546.1 acylneuraminate cytidylyltransferase family protein [Candidatus Peribacter sp.]MBT5638713.1 acylneuraminate cytidylyltransferase family protein [Candidatus Peribacter sp.]